MSKSPKLEEIQQKMKEEKEIDTKNIKNQIIDLLKCDICKFNFDLNIHIPLVAKCGHTYCKKCIYNGGKKDLYGVCPIDNIHHVLGLETCIPNLKLELIIKKIFNYTEPKIKEKKIVCSNHEIKLNNNLMEKIDDDKLFRSNSGNKNFFVHKDEFFPNLLLDKKNKTITNFKTNKDRQIRNLKLYNDNVDIIEELNVMNDDKMNISEKNKINDDSIDTIPINDDKSNANISFKDEFNELLNKNSQKNIPLIDEDNEIKNEKRLIDIEKNPNNNIEENNNKLKENKNNENINKENENKENIKYENGKNNSNEKNNANRKNIIKVPSSEIQRNSINFFHKNKKIEIDAIDEIDEYAIRPRTITVSKNNKFEKSKNNNKKEKIKEKNQDQDIYEIKKFCIYNKVSAKKRKTISQENNDRNRKIEIQNIKNKSEEKNKVKFNSIKEINKNYEISRNKNDEHIKEENENNSSDIYLNAEKKTPSQQKYKILSKKIGLKKQSEYTFNSNSNSNSPTNCNNSSEEKNKFFRPAMKYKSSINTFFKANKLSGTNSDETKNKTNINFISNNGSSFQKKKYIDNKLKNMNDYSSNSYHKTKSTYNKKKLKGKNNLFLTVKNNYNISLNNSNNNINSNTIINNGTLITHNNINKYDNNYKINNINRVKYGKISLSMSPDNKDNLENNNIQSTRDIGIFNNNNFTTYSKDINNIIKTITIKRVNSLATKKFGNQKNNNKIEEKNNVNDNYKYNIDDINEIKNKLRFDFNRVFNYQIDLYENLKEEKRKQILLSKNKKYRAILEEFFNQINNYDELNNTQICFLPDGELFIGQKELNLPKYGITFSLSGDYYKGSFINGKKDGNGIMIYKNGTRYEGAFKNNKHEGFGKLKQLDGETFIGEWKDGKINGNGVRCHCNGDRYIGSYVNNIRNGHGNYTFSNGDSYEGNWLNGKATGKGVFKFKNGDVYEGEFKENIIVGHGSFKTKNGDIYCGIFKNGLINGKGVLKYQNGEKYVGYFQNGKKNGNGKVYDINGKVYKSGYWKNDKYLGKKYI